MIILGVLWGLQLGKSGSLVFVDSHNCFDLCRRERAIVSFQSRHHLEIA